MARKVRHSRLETRTARLKLAPRRKPYSGPTLGRGIQLQYRRNVTGNGTWVLRAANGHGAYWTKAFAEADDFDNADGKRVVDFFNAQDLAKTLARGGDDDTSSAPVTVDGALVAYERDLVARGANAYNAKHPRVHLTATLLAKPVALLTSAELRKWRDGLLGRVKPATINRLCNSLCAAFEQAAQHDTRIKNRDAWEVGLEGMPDAQTARNTILSDTQVSTIVTQAYARSPALGLLIDTLAVTGARPSQATRLCVGDLHVHSQHPKLMLPKSAKGGGRNRANKKVERTSVPITPQLATQLKLAAKGRHANAPLLVRDDGQPWKADPSQDYRLDMREVIAAARLDPDEVTTYALRHSSIVRRILRGMPIRLVAVLHNTSVSQIERNYSRHIAEIGDDAARIGLLQHEAPISSNVVPLISDRPAAS
jgi:integrase